MRPTPTSSAAPRLLALVLGLCLSAAPTAQATEPTGGVVNPFEEEDESELYALDEQIVTVASRYAQTIEKAPNIVAVVTAQTIRERGYRTLTDILRDLPGLYVWRSIEGRDLVSFRGVVSSDNNKILLLVDGVPWYDGVYTHAWIGDFLPVAQIQQVEVIKGPGSAVYGTGAFSGVINIVTQGPSDLDGARVHWQAGGRSRSDVSVNVAGRQRVAGTEVSASAYARHLTQRGDGLDITPRGLRTINGEDPRSGTAVGARVNVAGLELQLHHVDFRHAFLTSAADDPYDVVGQNTDNFGLFYHYTIFQALYQADVSDRVSVTPRVWSHRYENPGSYFFVGGLETTTDATGALSTIQHITTVETEKDTRRTGAALDIEARPGIDHVTVAGAGTELTHIVPGAEGSPGILDRAFVDGDTVGESTGFEASGGLLNVYAYAQHTWTATPALELVLGARYDQRIPVNATDDPAARVFKPTATPRAGILLVPSDRLTVKVLYGRAFRSPNIRELLVNTTELDFDGSYRFANASLDLRPESIDTVEAEATGTPAEDWTLRATGSWSLVSNEIDKVQPPNEYRNLAGGLQIIGAEVEARYNPGPIDARLAYALTAANYGATGPYAGRRQFEIPPHSGRASVTARLGDHLSTTLLAEAYGARPRSEWGADVGLADGDPYALMHLSGRADALGPDQRVGVGFTVRNLLNTTYGTPVYRDDANRGTASEPRYPQDITAEGRMVYVSVDVTL